jgi:hypothetical protein
MAVTDRYGFVIGFTGDAEFRTIKYFHIKKEP